MYRYATLAAALAILSLTPGTAPAQALEDRVIEHRLENGMLFLLVPRTQAPVFTGTIMVKVGGVDEPDGKTGMSHMFEHMAFKGTPWIGTKDYEGERQLLERIDSVALAHAGVRATIPSDRQETLGALERSTLDGLAATGLTEEAIPGALAEALAETLRTGGDGAPEYLAEYVEVKRLEAKLLSLQAMHGSDFAVKD